LQKQANAIIYNDAAPPLSNGILWEENRLLRCDDRVIVFYATKNIVTGEGGMVVTDDKEIADKIKIYALHGMSKDAWKRFPTPA